MRQSLLAEVAACRRSDPWPTPRRLLWTARASRRNYYLLRLFSAVASLPLRTSSTCYGCSLQLRRYYLYSFTGASATCYGCSLQLHQCQCYLLRLFSAVASVPVLLVTAVLCICISASATCYGCSQQLRRYRCVTVLVVQCYRYQCYVLRLFCAVASLPLCTSGTCTVSSVPVVGVTADLYNFIGASGR